VAFAVVGAWLALSVLLGVFESAPGGLKGTRWIAAGAVAATLAVCLALAWGAQPAPFARWGSGLVFDALAHLLLPAVWTGMAGAMLCGLFLPDPRWELPIAGLVTAAATAGVMSSNALLTLALLQGCALLTLAGLVVRAERPGGNSLLRIATGLKYVTLTVVSAACLVMALLLANFFALNQDRIELPRIVAAVLVVGLGLAIGVMPFYFYVPDLIDAAPTVTSAGFAGPLQCLGFVYLLRTAGNEPWLLADGHVVAVLVFGGLAGALLAALLSFGQRTLRRLLAFNIIREAGWLAFGFGSVTHAGWTGALVFLVARCVGQPLLLSTVAVIEAHAGDYPLSHGSGLARWLPVASIAWAVGAAASAGVPPATNFWGLASLAPASASFGWLATLLLLASALLAVGRLIQVSLPMLWRQNGQAMLPLRTAPAPAAAGTADPINPALPAEREPATVSWLLGSLALGLLFGGLVPRLFTMPVSNTLAAFPFLR
jgi:multicomponent Na+:H+ antiporter subunit D